MPGGRRKQQRWSMGDYIPSLEERKAHAWCCSNYIKIYPVVHMEGLWRIGIQIAKGKENLSPEAYGPGEIWEKIYKFNTYYYNKYEQDRGSSNKED